MEKLDSLSKILLATGSINYMAASIDSVNEQIRMMPDKEGIYKEGIEHRDEVLAETVKDLAKVMNRLGDLINAQDACCPLDQYVTLPPFNVVVHGHDDPNGDFDEL